jgi:acetoacetate decarboxylase
MQSQSTVGDQKRGLFRELHGIAVAMEPADLSVYRSVLPAVLSVPDLPIVSAWIASWDDVQGLRPYREGAVRLRCAYEGKEGWFVTTMPISPAECSLSPSTRPTKSPSTPPQRVQGAK